MLFFAVVDLILDIARTYGELQLMFETNNSRAQFFINLKNVDSISTFRLIFNEHEEKWHLSCYLFVFKRPELRSFYRFAL